MVSVQRSCFLPEAWRPSHVDVGEGLLLSVARERRGNRGRGDGGGEKQRQRGADGSIRPHQQHGHGVGGGEGETRATPAVPPAGGIVSGGEADVLDMLLYHMLF